MQATRSLHISFSLFLYLFLPFFLSLSLSLFLSPLFDSLSLSSSLIFHIKWNHEQLVVSFWWQGECNSDTQSKPMLMFIFSAIFFTISIAIQYAINIIHFG